MDIEPVWTPCQGAREGLPYTSAMATGPTITYRDTADGIDPAQRAGFFVDWPNPPSPETHLRILARLGHLYMVDLLCDPDVQPFYARAGMTPEVGMGVRRYDRQPGAPDRDS